MKLKCKSLSKVFVVFSLGWGFVSSVVLSVIVWSAYFNPSKSVLVTIDTVGEATVEFVFMPVLILVCLFGFVLYFKSLWCDRLF